MTACFVPARVTMACVLLASCVSMACGHRTGPEETSGSVAASAGQVSGGDIDPCALVTSSEAGSALGAAAGDGERPKEANFPPRMVTCRYVAPRGAGVAVMTLLVQTSDTPAQARTGFDSARTQFPGTSAISGIGDDAFAVANQLNVLKGRYYVNITGDFDTDIARQLAQTAVQRLP